MLNLRPSCFVASSYTRYPLSWGDACAHNVYVCDRAQTHSHRDQKQCVIPYRAKQVILNNMINYNINLKSNNKKKI